FRSRPDLVLIATAEAIASCCKPTTDADLDTASAVCPGRTVTLNVGGSSPLTHPKHKSKAERKLGVPVNGCRAGPKPKQARKVSAREKRGKPLWPTSRLVFRPIASRKWATTAQFDEVQSPGRKD